MIIETGTGASTQSPVTHKEIIGRRVERSSKRLPHARGKRIQELSPRRENSVLTGRVAGEVIGCSHCCGDMPTAGGDDATCRYCGGGDRLRDHSRAPAYYMYS
jgi:hypothetical protein